MNHVLIWQNDGTQLHRAGAGIGSQTSKCGETRELLTFVKPVALSEKDEPEARGNDPAHETR